MKLHRPSLLSVLATLACGTLLPSVSQAQTPFTYQGKLENSGTPYTGTVQIRLGLYTVASGLTPTRQEVMTNVSVANGIFTVTPTTFIASDFPGAGRWLQIEVSTDAGGTYTTLTPRQQVTFTPYAIHAKEAETATTITGTVPATQISGFISPSSLGAGTINQTLSFSPVSGAPFAIPNAASPVVTNLNADKLDGLTATDFLRSNTTQFLPVSGGTLSGNLLIQSPANLSFGQSTGQQITLFNNFFDNYGMGVQIGTEYFRSGDNFAWFKDGVHSDTAFNPGAGGTTLMTLESTGLLSIQGAQNGYSLLNRSDATKRWIAYSEGVNATDSFRIWSSVTGDRLVVKQNGDTTVSGGLTAKSLSALDGIIAVSANPNAPAVSGYIYSGSGFGAGIYGQTSSPEGFGVFGQGAANGYGGKFVANGNDGWGVYGVSDTGFAGRFDGKLYASGVTTLASALDVSGGTQLNSTLSVSGFTQINNGLYATGATTLGSTLYAVGATTLDSTLTVSGASTFQNEVKSVGSLGGFSVNNRNNATKRWVMYSRNSGTTDQLAFYSGTGGDVAALSPNGDMYLVGALTTTVLTIRGGADVAEPFAMSKPDEMEPGCVVVIDEENPGKLKLSTQADDKKVAGIISGAGGVKPGLRLHQEGVLEGDHHVALSGRVYVKADASLAAIKPGDLLTTADIPGHAMKVRDHNKAQGAIIGKAMSKLDRGTGLVLVLVTLQ